MSHHDESRRHHGYEKICDQLMAELAKFEWRPIETAPKDGREFITCNMNQGGVKELVYYDKIHSAWKSKGLPIYMQSTHWCDIMENPKQPADMPPFLQNQAE